MTKQETYDYLRAHGVDFEITEHPAVFNMEECAAVDMPYPEDDAKNLLVRDDKKRNYYLITVRCGKRVDLKEFQRRHGTQHHKRGDELSYDFHIAPPSRINCTMCVSTVNITRCLAPVNPISKNIFQSLSARFRSPFHFT